MKQMGSFFILGIFSTAIDYCIYSFLVFTGIDYVLAIIAGYSGGFLFNFFIGRKHVFKNNIKVDSFKKEFGYVLTINIFALIFNILIVYILFSYLNLMNKYSARLIAIGIVFFWNYFARKIFIYK